jgi:hypothetical protein
VRWVAQALLDDNAAHVITCSRIDEQSRDPARRRGRSCRRSRHTTGPDNVKETPVGHDRERPLVEILYFDGCPNYGAARAMVERVSRALGLEPELRLVDVPDEVSARRLRFLGSPTIRVAGRDVDLQAGERDEYVLSCRVYRTENGLAGQPEERWVREALEQEASEA